MRYTYTHVRFIHVFCAHGFYLLYECNALFFLLKDFSSSGLDLIVSLYSFITLMILKCLRHALVVYCVTEFTLSSTTMRSPAGITCLLSYYLSFRALNCFEDAFVIHGLTRFKSALYKSVILIRHPPHSYNLLLLGVFCMALS